MKRSLNVYDGMSLMIGEEIGEKRRQSRTIFRLFSQSVSGLLRLSRNQKIKSTRSLRHSTRL